MPLISLFLAFLLQDPPKEPEPTAPAAAFLDVDRLSLQTGVLLGPGRIAGRLGVEWTQFEDLSDPEMRARAVDPLRIEALESSLLATLTVAYGVSDDVQLGARFGWISGNDPRVAILSALPSTTALDDFDLSGLTDLWITGKFSAHRDGDDAVAFVAGVKFPIGQDEEKSDAGIVIEPVSTAGTGAFDALFGLAWTHRIDDTLYIDLGGNTTVRGESRNYEVGQRIDVAGALNWRFLGADDGMRFTAFVGLDLRNASKSRIDGSTLEYTGGLAISATLGVRAALTRMITVSLAPQFPLAQALKGDQSETRVRILFGITVEF